MHINLFLYFSFIYRSSGKFTSDQPRQGGQAGRADFLDFFGFFVFFRSFTRFWQIHIRFFLYFSFIYELQANSHQTSPDKDGRGGGRISYNSLVSLVFVRLFTMFWQIHIR